MPPSQPGTMPEAEGFETTSSPGRSNGRFVQAPAAMRQPRPAVKHKHQQATHQSTKHRATLCSPAKTANQTPAGLNLRAGTASRAALRSPPHGLACPLCYAHARRHCWAQALRRRQALCRRRRRSRQTLRRRRGLRPCAAAAAASASPAARTARAAAIRKHMARVRTRRLQRGPRVARHLGIMPRSAYPVARVLQSPKRH